MKAASDVDLKVLRQAVKELNQLSIVPDGNIRIVGVKSDDLVTNFTNAVESVGDDDQDKIPENVLNLYNDITETVPDAAQMSLSSKEETTSSEATAEPAGETAEPEAGAGGDEKPKCFKKGWEEKATECVECLEGYPDDYNVCKAAVQAITKKAQKAGKAKATPKADPKPPKEKLPSDEFGFRIGSKSNAFGNMLKEAGDTGLTMKQVVDADWNVHKATFYEVFNKMMQGGHAHKDGKQLFIGKKKAVPGGE